jgi:uncharacterized protein
MRHNLGAAMTKGEKIGGFFYIPFYVIILAIVFELLFPQMGIKMSEVNLNLAYNFVNFMSVLIIFHKFLKKSFLNLRKGFWAMIQAVILGMVLYFVLVYIVKYAISFISEDVQNANNDTIFSIYRQNPWAMIACAVFLGPLVEELIFRGVIFGSLHKKNRIAAYAVMCLAFSAIHVWQYFISDPSPKQLLTLVEYFPGAIALGWCYEKGGNIWGSVLLHMSINTLAFLSPF